MLGFFHLLLSMHGIYSSYILTLFDHLYQIWYASFWDLYLFNILNTFLKNLFYITWYIIIALQAVEGLFLAFSKWPLSLNHSHTFGRKIFANFQEVTVGITFILLLSFSSKYVLYWINAYLLNDSFFMLQLNCVKNVCIKFDTAGIYPWMVMSHFCNVININPTTIQPHTILQALHQQSPLTCLLWRCKVHLCLNKDRNCSCADHKMKKRLKSFMY